MNTCAHPGCDRGVRLRGHCNMHYRRLRRRGLIDKVQRSRDDVLDEWDRLRGYVPFRDFHTRVSMTYEAWERAFLRAQAAGDPRAVRARGERRRRAS
jgi:hypothetical protein